MNAPQVAGNLIAAVGLVLLPACSPGPKIDWSGPENFFVSETSKETDEGALLEFRSLVDVPAQEVYDALADAEHYSSFVDGVSESGLISADKSTKVIHITETVIGRQARAKVKWTLHPEARKVEFETLQSDANYNDGSYTVLPSPDGKRSYVVSTFHVKWKGAPQNVPLGVLKSATRESFEKAARSVKKHALTKQGE